MDSSRGAAALAWARVVRELLTTTMERSKSSHRLIRAVLSCLVAFGWLAQALASEDCRGPFALGLAGQTADPVLSGDQQRVLRALHPLKQRVKAGCLTVTPDGSGQDELFPLMLMAGALPERAASLSSGLLATSSVSRNRLVFSCL